ncbi:MAG TPA: protein kinase [Anaerolineae bacterium]|nr:protein kinase [Anaerolineae bacterium]
MQNKYRIARVLGRGGFGTVYLAENRNLEGIQHAIKELVPDPNETPFQRQQVEQQFRLEASLLAKLSHPALPKVWDYFSEHQRLYLVMEYVEGETLEEKLMGAGAPLPEAQVLKWASQLCETLEYLHAQQPPIVHRDIKPSNIKLTPDGKLKLLDFGIAKVMVGRSGTLVPAVSPPYSPWEQYGSGTDPRSDIYALGVTLYQLLTNQLPPAAPDRNMQVLIPPKQWNPSLADSTQTLILTALAADPHARFVNASAMRAAIQNPLSVTLRAPGAQVGAWHSSAWTGNPPIPLWFAALGGGAVLIALLILFAGLLRSNNAGNASVIPAAPASATISIAVNPSPTPNLGPAFTPVVQPTVPPTPIIVIVTATSEPTAIVPTVPPTPSPQPTQPTSTLEPTWTPVPTTTPFSSPPPVPTVVPPTAPPVLAVVEDYPYANNNQLSATYVMNADWGVNAGTLRLDNRSGVPGMTLAYEIRKPPPDDYIVLDRCFAPPKNWNGASALEMFLQNDGNRKQAVLQFGEGRRCAGENFPGEVWRVFIDLAPNQSGWFRLPFSDFAWVDWAPSQNGRIDLNRIGYLAVGMRASGQGRGELFFGPIRTVP